MPSFGRHYASGWHIAAIEKARAHRARKNCRDIKYNLRNLTSITSFAQATLDPRERVFAEWICCWCLHQDSRCCDPTCCDSIFAFLAEVRVHDHDHVPVLSRFALGQLLEHELQPLWLFFALQPPIEDSLLQLPVQSTILTTIHDQRSCLIRL